MEEVFQFLNELRQHNERDWFNAHKEHYLALKARHEAFIDEVIAGLSPIDPEVTGLTAKECIFRIYRDTRFSLDKSPYKTHIGAFIARGGRQSPRGGYYVHMEPGASCLAGGIWCPPPSLLKALRMDIYGNTEEFLDIIENPDFSRYYSLDAPQLKKVPAPFPADFPRGDLLRYKYYTVSAPLADDFYFGPEAVQHVVERLALLYPLNRFLNYTVDETWHEGE